MRKLEWPNTLADVEAAASEVRAAGSVSVVGYCWGGTVAHVAASELTLDAAVSYYGGGVAKMLDKKPRCPIMYHFGDQDASIPLPDIEKIKRRIPNSPVHVYPGAGHGFNCDERAQLQREGREARVRAIASISCTSRRRERDSLSHLRML